MILRLEAAMRRNFSSTRARPRLFENAFFEFFTFFNLKAFVALWSVLLVGIATTAVLQSPTRWALPLVLAGWGLWTIVEYGLHRFVFHLEPKSPRLQQIVFIIHGNHHADPNDPLRNLMPPVVSISLGALIWLGCLALIGPNGNWFFLGFVMGYVVYDLVHYACHQFGMTGTIARFLKTHHMRHHFEREGGNYAITGMLWDRLFSTKLPSKRERA
jgi:sterol desaturase/sphingolipid hydroxylase (fatty acid hydroxylase superfamily)